MKRNRTKAFEVLFPQEEPLSLQEIQMDEIYVNEDFIQSIYDEYNSIEGQCCTYDCYYKDCGIPCPDSCPTLKQLVEIINKLNNKYWRIII